MRLATIALLITLVAYGFAARKDWSVSASIAVPCDSAKPQTVTVTLPQGRQGYPYTVTFYATSGTAPFSFVWIDGTLPGGLDWQNGIISGVPTSRVTTTFTVECRDANYGLPIS